MQNKNILDSYQVQLLLQCAGEFGYGNWEDICKQYNTTIHMEYPRGKRTYLSAMSNCFFLNLFGILLFQC